MLKLLAAWLVSFMLVQAPPDRPQYIKEAKETVDEAKARYESIATDITAVVFDEDEPALFKGPDGRLKSTAVILSIMSHESSFRRDVDLGLGPLAKGDGGRSVCMMQLNIGGGRTGDWNKVQHRFAYDKDPPAEIEKGWTATEIKADRKKCIRAGLRIMRLSFALTADRPVKEWLNVYASGKADAGVQASGNRMGLALSWYTKNAPTFTDDDILKAMRPTVTVLPVVATK